MGALWPLIVVEPLLNLFPRKFLVEISLDIQTTNPRALLSDDGEKPETNPYFGFGRCIYPGLHLAEASIWMSTAMSQAVFDIPKVVGNGIEINPASSSTIIGRYVTSLITSCAGLDRHNSGHLKPFSVLSSLALRKPSRSLSRMLTTKRAKMKLTHEGDWGPGATLQFCWYDMIHPLGLDLLTTHTYLSAMHNIRYGIRMWFTSIRFVAAVYYINALQRFSNEVLIVLLYTEDAKLVEGIGATEQAKTSWARYWRG